MTANVDGFYWWVALRKESVDRNYLDLVSGELRIKSLSVRRAWIEIWAHHTA